MAHTISIDVVDRTIPIGNNRTIPVINQSNPCYGYAANANEVRQLIQLSNYKITRSGTNKTITGNNYYDYFPEEQPGGGGGGGITPAQIEAMIDASIDSTISDTSTKAIQNAAITNFVNSSIESSTAEFKGTYDSKVEMDRVTANQNDYAFLRVLNNDDSVNHYERYKWSNTEVSGSHWLFEYNVNNSSFTAEQWAAINSGVKDTDVSALGGHVNNTNNPHSVTKSQVGLGNVDNTSDLDKQISTATQTALDAKADTATTYTKTEVDTALSTKQNTISDLSTIRSGASAGATAVQPISGKGLSTNDYTTPEKEKLAGIAAQANKTIVDSSLSESSTNPVQNKVIKSALDTKQDTLTTAQLAAVNSGITSTDVEQIETNKNNILSKANISDVNTATANLQAQINNIITPVTQDAEVQNARVGNDGTAYPSLKQRLDAESTTELTRASAEEASIRYSISDIIKATNLAAIVPALELGGLVGSTGAETSNNKRVRTGFIPVAAENWTITIPEGFAGHGVYYDETKARIGQTELWALVGTSTHAAPADAAYIRIMIKDDAETVITPTDVKGTTVFFKTKLQEIATELLEVESEIGQTNSDVDNIVDSLSLSDFSPALESGGLVASTGKETTNSKRVRTEFIRRLAKSCTVTIPTNYEAVAVYYNNSRVRVGADATWKTGNIKYSTTNDTMYIRLMIHSTSDVDITPNDITGVKIAFQTELSKTLREKSTSNWNLNTLIAAGLYNHMNSSPVASNAPVGEDSSKPFKLINYYDGVSASTVRQMFWSYTTGYIYVRYQISQGNFSTWKRIDFSADSTYIYNADNMLLTMETDKCRYIFKHMVDASIRLSAWRLYQGDLKVGTSYVNMWQNSDAEGVIHLEGEDDHLSGYHGDELNGTAQIYVNGVPLDMAKDSSGTFTTLTIKCTSDVYHCDTSEQADTKAFTREKELEFTPDGYKVHQHWIAADAVTIDRGAQALFQCYKTSGTNTVLYGMDADYIVGMQPTDFDNSTIYLDNRTVNVSMYTIGGKITITALQGHDNEYYRPNIRDFNAQNRDKIYLDMFNGKHLNVGESIYTGFKVDFK